MTDLSEVFGEDVAKAVRQKTAERRQERNKITEEQMAKICATAVNENKFAEGEPQFQYTTDNNITHTVLLMSVPSLENGTVWEYLDEPWEGAASLPLDYIGDWMRCTFPDKNDLKKIDSGDDVIVIGEIDEYEKDNGEIIESVYPVRGIATLEEVKEYAAKAMSDDGFAADESDEDDGEEQFAEPEEDEEVVEDTDSTEEEDSSDGDDGSEVEDASNGGWLDADESDDDVEDNESDPVPYDDIANLVEQLGEGEPSVWEVSRDDDRMDKLVMVVSNKLDIDNDDAIVDVIVDVIEEHNNQSEDDEDELTDGLFD